MKDVIVIGCGIMGATISHALLHQGRTVLTLDDGRPMSGTPPSGGHLKPSWFGSMSKSDYEPAIELLEELWGLIKEEFVIKPPVIGSTKTLRTTVYRVDTDVVLSYPRTNAKVTELVDLEYFPLVRYNAEPDKLQEERCKLQEERCKLQEERCKLQEERCKLLIVAAGVWSADLFPPELRAQVRITAKQGVSFLMRGKLQEPVIIPWAPYKQVVAHQQTESEIWVGDGSAIIPSNWTDERTRTCMQRCRNKLGLGTLPVLKTMTGLRPYAKKGDGDPCFLKQLLPRVWIATGAGKLGTIAAGWAADRLTRMTS